MIAVVLVVGSFCLAVTLFFLFDEQVSFWLCLGGAAAVEWLLCKAIDKSIKGARP